MSTLRDTRQRAERRKPWAGNHRERNMGDGPHVAEVERRIAELAEHYRRLGGWKALGGRSAR